MRNIEVRLEMYRKMNEACKAACSRIFPGVNWDPRQGSDTFERAVQTFGAQSQVLKCMEKMSELQKELCKHYFGEDNTDRIAEKLADVLIMLDQMILIHNCGPAVSEWMKVKLQRLEELIMQHEACRPCDYRDLLGNCKIMSEPGCPITCEKPGECELKGRI